MVQTLFRLNSKWSLLSEPQNTSSSTSWPWYPMANMERWHLNTHWKRTSLKFVHQIYININIFQTSKQTSKKSSKIQKKRTVVICTKGARFFVVKFLFLFKIVISNPSCKFLLQIHIVNSYCKCLSYIPIPNYCNCNASLVNVAQ